MLNTLLLLAVLAAVEDPPELRQFRLGPDEVIAATIHGSSQNVVVIIPGLIGGAYSFRQVIAELELAGRRVIIVDVLGTGASTKPSKADYSLTAQSIRVAHVLDSLKVQNATLLTHAIAGSIGYRLALHRPDQVRAIVTIDGGAAERSATSGLRRALTFAPLIKLFGTKRIMVGKVRGEISESSGDRSWITEEVLDNYTAPYREDADQMLDVLKAMADSPEPVALVPNLRSINAQVTLLVGNQPPDKVLSPEKIEVLRKGLKHFRVETIDGAGVFIQEERPAAVVRAVLAAGGRPPDALLRSNAR